MFTSLEETFKEKAFKFENIKINKTCNKSRTHKQRLKMLSLADPENAYVNCDDKTIMVSIKDEMVVK